MSILLSPVFMVATYTEHTRSNKLKTLLGDFFYYSLTQTVMVSTFTEHTKSINGKPIFEETPLTIAYFSCHDNQVFKIIYKTNYHALVQGVTKFILTFQLLWLQTKTMPIRLRTNRVDPSFSRNKRFFKMGWDKNQIP